MQSRVRLRESARLLEGADSYPYITQGILPAVASDGRQTTASNGNMAMPSAQGALPSASMGNMAMPSDQGALPSASVGNMAMPSDQGALLSASVGNMAMPSDEGALPSASTGKIVAATHSGALPSAAVATCDIVAASGSTQGKADLSVRHYLRKTTHQIHPTPSFKTPQPKNPPNPPFFFFYPLVAVPQQINSYESSIMKTQKYLLVGFVILWVGLFWKASTRET